MPQGNDYYCLASELTTNLAQDGPAAPLQRCVKTALADTPAPGKHIQVKAGDSDDFNAAYAAAECGDVLLAYEMNGEQLPRDHGYPLRLLAPGHAGCRNVKWIKQIIVSQQASDLDSGSKLEKLFCRRADYRHPDDRRVF